MLNKILACSVSREVIVIALISCLCFEDQIGLCSINCHIYAMTGHCFTRLQVFADSLQVVSAMTGNLSQDYISRQLTELYSAEIFSFTKIRRTKTEQLE